MPANHRVGWLGTGRMGAAMAARLISDGAAVTVWNRTASKTQPLVEQGADRAEKISDLGQCNVVFTSVSSSPDLLAVTLGPDGLFDAQPAPSIVVDTSTVSAEAAAEVRAEARFRGCRNRGPETSNRRPAATALRRAPRCRRSPAGRATG